VNLGCRSLIFAENMASVGPHTTNGSPNIGAWISMSWSIWGNWRQKTEGWSKCTLSWV